MRFHDREHLQAVQYRSPERLKARIRLHELFSTNPLGFYRWIFNETAGELPGDTRLLEVGGGHGRLWSAVAGQLPRGWSIALTDFSAGMAGAAAADPQLRGMHQLSFGCADVQDLPFPAAAFDAVFAHFMLYHVPDRERAYREIGRVLKPGGAIYAVTLGSDHLREIYELAERVDASFTDRAAADWVIPFRLDNGPGEFARHFTGVTVRAYDDALEITEAEPLIEYIRSLASTDLWTASQADRLRSEIGGRLARERVIRVRKEVGMIVARRPGD